MNPLYEKYFLGEMDAEERARLEEELAQNPDMRAQFEEERQFAESLKNQMLRRKIKAALAPPEPVLPVSNAKKNRWWMWFGLAALLLLSWAIWRSISGAPAGESPIQPAPPQKDPEKSTVPIVGQPPAPAEKEPGPEKKDEKQRDLIAQAPIEPRSLQGLRGHQTGRTPWADLVEKIWYAPLPPAETFDGRFGPAAEALSKGNATDAFLLLGQIERQAPDNDTLAFLKGWCLMELWEGRDALRYFGRLSGKPNPWEAEVEWSTGLCFLTTGEKDKAVAVFKKIAARPKHAYRKPAENALKLLH